ncbi:MAG: hypothetical protein ABJE47_07575 [bacterium]
MRITSDGALHLFWSEGPNSQLPTGWPTTFNAVWHASYAAGKWTPAERVIRGTWLNWDSHAPQVIVDDRGRLHMLISVADSGRAEEVYHLLRDRDGWHRAGTGMYGLYPALAHISGGQLVMALVMYDGNGKSSGLYTRTSTDYGSTWNQRVRVLPTTDTTAVYHPQLRFVRDTLYLGWTSVRKEGDIWRLSKRGMRTVADTEAWLPPVSSAPMEGRIVNAMFAVHGCGDVRALAEIFTGRMNQVRVIHVHESQAAIEKAFGDEFIMAPHTEQTSDRVIQIWNAVLPRTDSLRPFFREYATCR